MVSEKIVERLAAVCRLRLSLDEIKAFAEDLTALESLAAPLLEIQESHTLADEVGVSLSELREDVWKSEPAVSAELLAGAPARRDGYVLVPRTVEEA